MSFSESQSRAIAHGAGPAMVLAGPGSGKTTVITNRIQYLIETLHVRPEEILVITFTRAAASEMRERFERLASGSRSRVNFGTFHAVFFQILKYAYHYSAENILRDSQKMQILTALAERENLAADDLKEMVNGLAAEISVVKNEQIPIEHYYAGVCGAESFRRICRGYNEELRRRNLIDFDDMLSVTYDLLTKRPDILAQWQAHFRWILVDEFQDINTLQYQILKLLALPENNLFAVGDDDQSIYRFRGARPEIMLGFKKDYPGAAMLHLSENYRCSGAITEAAGEVIAENKTRYAKQITCMQGRGGAVDLQRYPTLMAEGLGIVKKIRKSVEAGRSYDQIAVLVRTNTGGRYIAEKLMEFGIPFEMKDTLPNLYDHWIAQDLTAYLRMAIGPVKRQDFLRVMNHPLRYIARDCVDTQEVRFERLRMWYEDKPWMVKRLDTFEEELQLLGRLRPFAAINYIRSGMQYDSFLEEYAREHRMQKEELLETAEEILESARPFPDIRSYFDHIEAYRRELEEQKKTKRPGDKEEPAVAIATLHGSKGLEFEEVFLPDLNEGIIPHKKASLQADMEEERRLLYVGMTRAKKELHLYYLKDRYGKEQEPSRFLEVFELPE